MDARNELIEKLTSTFEEFLSDADVGFLNPSLEDSGSDVETIIVLYRGNLAFSLRRDGVGWLSGNSKVQSALEVADWSETTTTDETALMISGLLLWWLHVDMGPPEEGDWSLYQRALLEPTVRYWNEMYQSTDPSGSLADFVSRLTGFWVSMCETYGFTSGLDEAPGLEAAFLQQRGEAEPTTDNDSENRLLQEFASDIARLAGRYVLDYRGVEIGRSTSPTTWKAIRRKAVTATDALKLLRKNGKPSKQRVGLLKEKVTGVEGYAFDSYQRGIEREPIIAEWLRAQLDDVEANDLLFCGENSRHLATPDMLGDNYIVEIKVSSQPLSATLKKYEDQVQWQMHVMGVPRALLVVENRYSEAIESLWLERDDRRIESLALAADYFLKKLDSANQLWDSDVEIEDFDFFDDWNLVVGSDEWLFQEGERSSLRAEFIEFETESSDEDSFVWPEEEEEEEEEDFPPENLEVDESNSFTEGNPYRELRVRCGISQKAFSQKYGFGKMTMVYLESGMYTKVSQRQLDAIETECREVFFDAGEFLRRHYKAADLNDAYATWQKEQRRAKGGPSLAALHPPFPFTREHSPLFFLIRDAFGSIQKFCKTLKIPSITLTRHLEGQTRGIPIALSEAIFDTGYENASELLAAQEEWIEEYR